MATCARCSYFRAHIDPALEDQFGKCDDRQDDSWMSPATLACPRFTTEPSPGHRRYAGALVFAIAWSSSVLPALFWILIMQWMPILGGGLLAWAIVLVLTALALAVPAFVIIAYRRPPR